MHSRRIFLSAILGTALLSGCASSPAPSEQPARANASAAIPERCSTEPLADLIGKPGSPELLDQARQRSGAQRARMLHPDDMMTMDYDSQRLNLDLEEQGRVYRLSCG